MKLLKLYLPVICLLIGVMAFGQRSRGAKKSFWSKINVTAAAGLANYYGDLTQNAHWFNQSSFALSGGVSYPIIPHINARADLSFMKLQAADNKNSRLGLLQRNLNFKSYVWDFTAAIEVDMRNMAKRKFSPYAFVGFGAFYFNPYTTDANGYRQFLQYLGTEGQGLAAYPDRKFYHRLQTEIPFGGGLKWRCKKVTMAIEFKYRKTHTDYLDDVSTTYATKAALDARNPRSAMLAYRGDQVGAGPYPTNPNLRRGNDKKNDAFYTTQFKVMFRL